MGYSYFTKVQSFPEICDGEIADFTNLILEIDSNPTPEIQDTIRSYYESRLTEGVAIVPDEEQQTTTPYDFSPFFLTQIKDWGKFKFIRQVMQNVPVKYISVFVFKGGQTLYPHTDRGRRKYVVNFPILNATTSETCFYKITDPNVKLQPSWCYMSDIQKVATMVYEPKTLYALNVQQVHSVEAKNSNPRIVLSAGINGNPYYNRIVDKLIN